MDKAIGKFFSVLKERGLYDRSLIIVLADHGEQFGERGQEGGLVEGEIQVGRLAVAGTVKGTVRVKERLVVHGSGKVLAEVFAPTLVVDEGGVMEGVVHMTAPAAGSDGRHGGSA